MTFFSLQRIKCLLEDLGKPQNNIPPVIHIGGTNGKGSVASFIQRLLETSGLSVHVHTSPHLIRWNERFRLGVKGGGGKLVEDAIVLDTFRRVIQTNNDQDISVFEASVATAFVLFAEYPADVAIIEVGLGGRFDATNIIEKTAVSVITSISLDHEKYLGKTVGLIAKEKAAIMKRGCPVVIGHQSYDEARDVLVSKAQKMGCTYRVYGDDFYAFRKNRHLVYQDKSSQINCSTPNLFGEHQYFNAATAICAVQTAGFKLEKDCVNIALQSVNWLGRLQKITKGFLLNELPNCSELWIDGGHNPDAGLVIAREISKLKELDTKTFYLVIGMLADKDYEGYLKAFVGLSPIVLTVPIMCKGHESIPESINPQILMQGAKKLGLTAFACSSLTESLVKVKNTNKNLPPAIILIGGSLYLAGEALYKNGTYCY
ncbi:bifunctional folylpolyglutamate synthase/dihydrofolate synthase [Candidatus Liberibacter solanacearum]|uniref:tetrahydrofolate synthase n=1 Tax=Candidatus Liberibacter solanacearum TaxID=556287 RepID=A0A424FN92_9HYPH|nr:folylpolyglutamate synthase/dihydrofolate synthase family protein [Candidatus Liberibacter solanacearum]RPD37630.1 bifunctional folylpolyglutamate synthase/dihydrofolate synthase [Candidatus Liberibacter solanacearum]